MDLLWGLALVIPGDPAPCPAPPTPTPELHWKVLGALCVPGVCPRSVKTPQQALAWHTGSLRWALGGGAGANEGMRPACFPTAPTLCLPLQEVLGAIWA